MVTGAGRLSKWVRQEAFLPSLTCSLFIAAVATGGFLSRYRSKLLDQLFRWRGAREPPAEVAIVTIDGIVI